MLLLQAHATMFYYPDLITYLWLIPVFLLLLIPLAITMVGISRHLARRFLSIKEILGKEKRKHPRFDSCEDTYAEITVGDTICTGLVCNISKVGISLKGLPDKFTDKMDRLTVVIRDYGKDHNLSVKPKWVTVTESGNHIGAEIDTVSPGWNKFLMQTERINQLESV